ncbi:hypothetical protein ACFLTM_02070 [Candidatus Bipolaricaulota bacterium]
MAVTVPGGSWLDGRCCRDVTLRPLRGSDEAFLHEAGTSLLPVQLATALLARCVEQLGAERAITPNLINRLTVGDREALMLQLRRLAFGDRMPCTARCPDPVCGEQLEWDLEIKDLLQPPYTDSQEVYETSISAGGGDEFSVRFRLPTGADQEAAAAQALDDVDAAADLIFRRCVEAIATPDGEPAEPPPETVRARVPDLMSEFDPQAELSLSLTCPACGGTFSTVLDASAYFFQEVDQRADDLYREVHTLAFHYHWSESEIMTMTTEKRHRYLGLLADALTEGAVP